MVDEEKKYLIISYATCVFALVAFASYAIIRYTIYILAQHKDQDAEKFVTARGTASALKIAFSYFATAVGAWCLVSPSQFAAYTGIVGLALYAFASGFPVFLISLFGDSIQKMHPDVMSISDFAGKRFGPVFQTIVVLLCLFNMSIAMLAEYTTIGSLFKDFVGSENYPIVIVVGILTMAYTAYGGLYISILTDQLQAVLTMCFIGILTIFVAVKFREPMPEPLPKSLGPNNNGYSAIFSMPCSLLAASVFSEAVWQKVWASNSRRSNILGGAGAAILITFAVFLFGFAGWLAFAGGLANFDYDEDGNPKINPNLYLFQVFKTDDSVDLGSDLSQPARVRSWIGVVALILGVTMNESAVDSLQSGITGTITSHFLRDQHVIFTRMVVIVINIPLIIVSLQGYPILSLFLISNMLTSCCFLPVLSGVFPITRRVVTESCAVFGCFTGILTTLAYGAGRWYNGYGRYFDDDYTPRLPDDMSYGERIKYGMTYAFYKNINYDWDYFLVAAGSSVVGMLLWIALSKLIFMTTGWEGPGVSGALSRMPGYGFITGKGLGFDLLSAITRGRYKYNPDSSPSTRKGSVGVEMAPTDSPHDLAAIKKAAANQSF